MERARRDTGRDFLLAGQPEKPGFGLYSYILFGSPPNDATRARYLETIKAFLGIPEVGRLERYRPTCELNVTYLPVNDAPPQQPTAEWLLEHYDYARASTLLKALPASRRNGPYIISTYKPLSGISKLTGQYLLQDLSSTPPEIVVLWVKEFLAQVEQEQFWEERTVMQCVLRLRESIAVAAAGFPAVQKSLSTLIDYRK